MIQISIGKNDAGWIEYIEVIGHANYAEYGEDIICASVSTLLQVVGYRLVDCKELEPFVGFKESGFGTIQLDEPTKESHLITSVFEKGAQLLDEQYPEHVRLEYVTLKVS